MTLSGRGPEARRIQRRNIENRAADIPISKASNYLRGYHILLTPTESSNKKQALIEQGYLNKTTKAKARTDQ
jgi:hypothetical protein